MAKITWMGEDFLHKTVTSQGVTVEGAGPSFTTWGPYKFKVGEAVEVTDQNIIKRAKGNKFFKVEEEEKPRRGRPPKVTSEDGDQNQG